MEPPNCFSHYFVNKQNVRSIENILNMKLLKRGNGEEILLYVLEDKSLVSELSTDFISILHNLITNVRRNCKHLQKYFNHNKEQKYLNISHVNKEDIFTGCWSALYEIIPNSILGSQHNIKIFKNVINIVLFSMKRQHIFLFKLIQKFDMQMYPWNTLSESVAKKALFKITCWMIKYILSAIICLNFFVTTCKIDTNENKLYYFWKNQWQSFYSKAISKMMFSRVISRFEPYCMGKKVKRKYSSQERFQLKILIKGIPKLHLILKPNSEYRAIVRYRNDDLTSVEKAKIKERLNFLKVINGKPQEKIEIQYSTFHSGWVNLKCPKVYFVKTDLSNAFGSINRERLMKILAEKHLEFQKTKTTVYLKRKFAQIYREINVELHKPLLVRAGSTVYEWKEGLVQGYKYSPALSELYYTYMDNLYLSEHFKKCDTSLQMFIRIVDDYLYVTDSLENAKSFLDAISNYRNVNYDKTVVNFQHPTIKFSNNITFMGYTYNTLNLEVNRASNVYTGQMCYKIAFSSAISNLDKFLENRIGQSGIQVNGHLFNLNYNNEELIWKHIFLTFSVSANKFCTILAILCNEKEMLRYLELYKKRVSVKLCNSMIETLIKNKQKDYLFVYCINHFRYLSFKALILCAKLTPKCNNLVPYINVELAKTNCIFGKWREHASRINKSGIILRSAVKEVCRRADLRQIIKRFDVLPDGLECHNHKTFYK